MRRNVLCSGVMIGFPTLVYGRLLEMMEIDNGGRVLMLAAHEFTLHTIH